MRGVKPAARVLFKRTPHPGIDTVAVPCFFLCRGTWNDTMTRRASKGGGGRMGTRCGCTVCLRTWVVAEVERLVEVRGEVVQALAHGLGLGRGAGAEDAWRARVRAGNVALQDFLRAAAARPTSAVGHAAWAPALGARPEAAVAVPAAASVETPVAARVRGGVRVEARALARVQEARVRPVGARADPARAHPKRHGRRSRLGPGDDAGPRRAAVPARRYLVVAEPCAGHAHVGGAPGAVAAAAVEVPRERAARPRVGEFG